MDETSSENNRNILIVDDSEDNLYLMQFVLETQGYKVLIANSGKKALNYAKQYRPDLILLDLMMPQMNGYEVMERLRRDRTTSTIPVSILTANKYFSYAEAKNIGAEGIVYKPLDLNRLLQQVASFLKVERANESSANY